MEERGSLPSPSASALGGPTRHWLYPQLSLREGERVLFHVRQSQVTNVVLHLALLVAAASLLAQGPIVAGAAGLVAFVAWFMRAHTFYFITDERVIVVYYDPNSTSMQELSIDHRRMSSVKVHDPILFGATLGIQRIDIFVAESNTPKASLRWLHNAHQLKTVIGRRN